MKKKNIICIGILVIIFAVTTFLTIKFRKDKTMPKIFVSELTKNEQKYLELFYQDPLVSKGELFNIRYIYYHDINDYIETENGRTTFSSCIEIVNNRNANITLDDCNDISMSLVAANGEKYRITIYSILRDKLFRQSNLGYFSSIIFGHDLDEMNEWIKKNKVDLMDIKIEVEYRYDDKVEIHHLVYDKEERKKQFNNFFNSYYNDEITLDSNTERLFNNYYLLYNIVLKNDNIQSARSFINEFWNNYKKKNSDFESELFVLPQIIYNYVELDSINQDNVTSTISDLKSFIYENKSYIDKLDKEMLERTSNRILYVLKKSSDYDASINKKEVEKDISKIIDNREEFWKLIAKYFK